MAEEKVIPVRVAVRSRPLVTKEIVDGCQPCVQFVPNEPQIIIGRDKAFTFDYTFNLDSKQIELYNKAVADRIDYIFKGYNVTVLAYGQTGSGKTYTMGTAYSSTETDEESQIGIIQRAVNDIFNGIKQRCATYEFSVKVSFLEVYKEDVYDLLNRTKDVNTPIAIREDLDGIKIVGLTELEVSSAVDTLLALEQGSLRRTTASTAMNARSSRSHAIFTVIIEQRNLNNPSDFMKSRFHLVDLAGSERANKTGALGERFKEGVKINKGLLALGNVISALGDESSHIPYRDSKLTRLLQDSLGGNSHTVMIACVSPADSNLEETLNTLRYADRARKIKNKPIINRDPQNAEISKLKQELHSLKLELMKKPPSGDANTEDLKIILDRNQELVFDNERLEKELQHSLEQITSLCEKSLKNEQVKEQLMQEVEDLYKEINSACELLKNKAASEPVLMEQLNVMLDFEKKFQDLLCGRLKRNEEFCEEDSPEEEENQQPDDIQIVTAPEDQSTNLTTHNTDGKEAHSSTMKQAAMSRELIQLEKALAMKEGLAAKMKANDSQMFVMRLQFETNLKQMEEEINVLQSEKEMLAHAFKTAQSNSNVKHISEQRRKRLQECEAQIAELKKQILEKSRIMRLKDEASRKVLALQQEIQTMKATRVGLLRKMKEEAERFRAMRLAKEREVAQLKQQDRKRQYEMVKLKQDFTKQKNVMKRKMEEASAANKRLHEALTQQKSIAERRMKDKQGSLNGIGTRVTQWLIQEMEVALRNKEAQFFVSSIIENRKHVTEQLNILRSMEESKPSDEESDESDERKAQIKAYEYDIEQCNVKIAELNQQIVAIDKEERSKERWETIHGLIEAKCALQWLFDKSVGALMEAFHQKSKYDTTIEELQSEVNTYKVQIQRQNDIIQHTRQKMAEDKQAHDLKVTRLVRDNEDKTLFFLKQMNSTTKDMTSTDAVSDSKNELMERITFQEAEITRLSYLNDELQKALIENEVLRHQLLTSQRKSKPNLGDFTNLNSTFVKPESKPKKSKKDEDLSAMEQFLESEEDSFISVSDCDDANDLDFRGTPLRQRNKRVYSEDATTTAADDSSESDTKRKRLKLSCNCRSKCSTKKCSCRKSDKICNETCKCGDICCNRSKDGENDCDSLNSTYQIDDSSRSSNTATSTTVLTEFNLNTQQDSSVNQFVAKPRTKKLYNNNKMDPDIKRLFDEGGLRKIQEPKIRTLGPLQI